MEVIADLIIATMLFVFYFIPTIIAYKRKHHNLLAIGALNVIFGVSGIGWGVAFVWSLTRVEREI